MKLDVKQQIKGKPLSLVTDESTDISQNRLINTSVVTPDGLSYTWDTLEAKEGAQTSEVLFEELLGTATDITDGRLSQIVSLSTDTCGTMRSLWKIVSKHPQTKMWITIPCDSHGIQLLIKDILMIPPIEKFWKLASNIVNAFRHATKQYQYL